MSSSALAFLALVAFTAAQTLSADEQQLLEQLQNRDQESRRQAVLQPKIRTARQTLDLAVRSEGDVTFTIGTNASVSISQIPQAMRAYSDAAVDAMSFGYTMGENAGNVAGQLAAEQVRTELVRVAAAANASIREVAQDLAASQAASEVRVTESVDAVSRTVAELRRELQDEAGQLPINSALGCTTSAPGQLRFNNASQSVEVCSSGAWSAIRGGGAGIDPHEDGSSEARAGPSCKAIKAAKEAAGEAAGNGVFWMYKQSNSSARMRVYCDMSQNGGGWTMVAFAGRIRGNKRTTVGSGNFAMLFHNFGPYTHNALATRTPFSWMKNAFFNDIFKDSSEIMATSASKRNGMIFPVQDKIRWNANYLPHVPYIKTRRGATSQWLTRTGSVNVFQYTTRAPAYIGYDWAACSGRTIHCQNSNNDNWGDYNNGPISHRAMLYWEPGDSGYTATQWFHASPLSMHRSSSPANTVQDIAFFLRENTHSSP